MVPVPEIPFIVTILAPPGGKIVWIRLIGALDMGTEPELDRAIDRVRDVAPGTVLIDLAGVTFAGSLLVHFLIHVHAASRRARIRLIQATPTVRLLVTATGIGEFITVDGRRSPRPT